MASEAPIEVVRNETGVLVGFLVWAFLAVLSVWVLSAVGTVGLWVVGTSLFLGGVITALVLRPRIEIYSDGLRVVMPFSSERVSWDQVRRFRMGNHPAWGLMGWVDLADGYSLPLWMIHGRRWQESAGLDGPWRRIDRLNDLRRRFTDDPG